MTDSTLAAKEVVKIHNGRTNVEHRIKEGENTLCCILVRKSPSGCGNFELFQCGRLS